jgi:hypothetical protein
MSSICLGNNEPRFREYVSFIIINEVHNVSFQQVPSETVGWIWAWILREGHGG